MRLLLGGLLLVVLFLAATTWQKHWTSQARAERSAARGSGVPAADDLGDGWSRVIVGRPSGSEAHVPPAQAQVPAANAPVAPSPTTAEATAATSWTVEPGQSLSLICKAHYGSARLEIVEAVAKHNGLASPDLVREGQKLELPPIDALLPKR
ncbi:MAG TPA: LysM domain-containing protein [Planctomycetota bacterium]|nr:LysM domain-containing protein [Planctomycetota bacterium]